MNRGWLWRVRSRFVEASPAVASHGNHVRLGTEPDRRRRRGMDRVLVMFGQFCRGDASWGLFGFVEVCFANHHAVGAVSASTPNGGI
jgi:hypothetical protein